MNQGYNIEEVKKFFKTEGQTQIDLIINDVDKKIHYNLKNLRKFDFNQLKILKSKEYVKKITV